MDWKHFSDDRKKKMFVFAAKCPNWFSGVQPVSYTLVTTVRFPRVKRSVYEADYLSVSSTEVENDWSSTSTFLCSLCMLSKNFNLCKNIKTLEDVTSTLSRNVSKKPTCTAQKSWRKKISFAHCRYLMTANGSGSVASEKACSMCSHVYQLLGLHCVGDMWMNECGAWYCQGKTEYPLHCHSVQHKSNME
jgi:hypothetical protein